MNQPLDRLYNLLPAIYRLRDAAEGEPLRALLAAVEGELRLIESDISNLYENWFIETCDEWVVPYIGDLLSTQELYGGNPRAYGQQQRRAYVANTLAYRRRKGTVTVLEQLVRDVTDWRARAVEFYKLLATTQNLSHIRPEITTVDLRSNRQPEQVGSPFEQRVAYTVEVRRAASGSNLNVGQSRGRYNVRHVGLFVWRLQSYPIQRSLARSVAGGDAQPTGRYYTFHPLGYDKAPLFNQPQTETDILHLAEEINLPVSLRRSVLSRELEARHRQQLQGFNWQGMGYFADNPVLQVYLDGQPQPLPPEAIQIRPLKNDNAEDANDWVSVVSDDSEHEHRCDWKPLPAVVAIDPEAGRLAILGSNLPKKVEVSYLYGFSGDVGGGMYNREQVASSSTVGVPPIAQEFAQLVPPLMWQVKQAESAVTNPLAAAVKAWNQTVQAWQDLREHIAIPLAKIMIPPTRVSRVTGNPKLPSRPRFTPGVVKGLTVRINRRRAVAIVNPGIAVDGQGRRIHLDTVQEINLNGILQRSQSSLEPQRFLLVASFLTIPEEQSQSPSQPQSIPIGIIPETALEAYPPGTFIELQRLEVAEGTFVETTAIAPQMSAGIVSGLDVLAPNGKIEVMVTSGTAVDRRGRVIVLVTNQAIDLRAYQKQRGSLVLVIARRRNKRNWQIKFIPEAEKSNHENHRQEHIHLASLDIPNVEATLIPLPRLIQGLEVVPQPGMLAVRVTPGKAIDSRGEAIALHSESDTIDLMPYRGKTVQLVLFTGADRRYPRGTLRVIQPGEVERVVKPIDQDMELDTYIVLANLYLTPEFLSVQPDESEQPPWLRPVGRVLDGLSVKSSPQTPARIEVQPGEAIDGEQRTIHLESDCHFDLSSYAGRTLILFMSHQWGQGLPDLTCVSPSLGSGWKQIGVVPEEPWTADTGTIVIGDNGTYRGNLSITVPSDRKLQIIAANGCRPHIRGNLDIQGTSTMDNVLFNTLTVDGLLVEGLLTVLPGRLKHLQVRHCTILSKAGGLVVQRQVVSEELEEADDSITLVALIMYCLTLIQRLLRLGMGLDHPSPKQNLAQLARLGFQEFLQLTDAIQKAVDYWWASECSDDVEDDLDENSQEGDRPLPENDEAGDNERLEIDIKQTICGAIALADTVAHLAIADSILDAGYGKPTGSGNDGSAAITASGTAVDISTTTVFGRVAVRRLEASNSIFTAKVTALRQQVGCMRFCHVPEGSRTPTRYLCQPERALLESLNILPEKITAFAIAKHPVSVIASTPNSPDTSQTINPVFTSTGGGGVFYCNTHNNGNENKKDEWEKTQNQPSNLNVTALLAYFNAAGTLILWAGTAGGGLFRSENRGERWQSVSSGLTNTKVIALTRSENFVFAGTAGGGVLRTDDHSAGTPLIINRGLTNTNITAIANHPDGRLFVGTEGGGVFRLEQDERWTPINAGLTNRNITALVFDANGQLFAGTDGGGVFSLPKEGDRPLDGAAGNRWIPVGLSSDRITALAVYCRAIPQGSISSQDTTVTGTGTQFQAALREGDIITAFDQFKCIKTIQSDTELTIDSAFRPDLPPETSFILNNPLYAATADGKLFRSIDSGQNWTSLPLENGISKGAEITALSVAPNNEHIFVGTAIGNIWHSQDRGKTWTSMNQGLTNVDEKLLIMNRLYPRFTSRDYGDPGYGQLSRDCAVEIYTGADDGAEMGVFNSLKQPQREASLQASLDEYLRFGLEASIFYMT